MPEKMLSQLQQKNSKIIDALEDAPRYAQEGKKTAFIVENYIRENPFKVF